MGSKHESRRPPLRPVSCSVRVLYEAGLDLLREFWKMDVSDERQKDKKIEITKCELSKIIEAVFNISYLLGQKTYGNLVRELRIDKEDKERLIFSLDIILKVAALIENKDFYQATEKFYNKLTFFRVRIK